MTIYPQRPASFICAICREHQDYDSPWRRGSYYRASEYCIPPVCRDCEKTWGKAIGGWGDLNRDRRIARQISALAAVIEVEAYRSIRNLGPLYAKR